ncbi:calcium-binding protein [Pararhizobium antarcticum]|uniref:Calcium-binding protein n=1 Tax=Pararhizobium antarcticum TaxID=1798805 RepID=A0A657LNJ4_9HYPH|nr:calcium-binding protein [Pararhizobium antarcticum]OJF92257.1 hypothetical protein AX760_05930 [Pararhizobium antarcticum]
MGVTITGNNSANRIVQDNRSEIIVNALGGDDVIILNLVGNLGGDNFVDAGSGNDIVDNRFEGGNEIRLGAGNDTYVGNGFALTGEGFDRVFGGDGNDTIAVSTSNSVYFGEDGNDTFISEGWQNFFSGGAGTDTLSYELRDESNVLGGSGVTIDLAQNFANTGAIRIEEFSSIENATGTNVGDTIFGSSVNNVLKGRGGSDLLVGRAGNDTLDGGTSADEMIGGAGNDTYIVQNSGDIVDELNDGGAGIDTVKSSISFSLEQSAKLGGVVEKLTLTGSNAINGTGNSAANTLTGNSAANTLNGGSGDDTLNGGLGKDVLTGGTGADKFLFKTALNASTNVDRITDFNVIDDTIQIDNAIFTTVAGTGTLSAAQFVKNTTGFAGDGNDRIIYESDTGKIFFDSNGSASGGSVHFATVGTNLALTSADFFIV